MLDSANFNTATVNITKSVSILAIPGAVGSVVATAGPAINIATAGIKVALRNLMIVPLAGGGGTSGVVISGGVTSVSIEGSVFANLTGPAAVSASGVTRVRVTSTVFRNNAQYAILLQDGPIAMIADIKVIEGGYGGVFTVTLAASTQTFATVSDSILSCAGSSGLGVGADTELGASTVAATYVTRSTIENCDWGLYAYAATGTALVTVSSSMVTKNVYGYYIENAGGTAQVRTLQNNHLVGNSTNAGTLTTQALQ
jgi:hypothetical protein